MDLNYIRKLVKLVDESGVDELEIEEEGTKVRVSKARHNSSDVHTYIPQYITQPVAAQQPMTEAKANPSPVAEAEKPAAPKREEKKYHEVRSPIVGTFYRSPAPNADPYVQIGSSVQPGSVMCIVEAMKLMNEIEADVGGTVVQILVENMQPVEYNQPLFLVEPA